MVANSQQFGIRLDPTSIRKMNEIDVVTIMNIDNQRIENRHNELASIVNRSAMNQAQALTFAIASVYGICSLNTHLVNACPIFQENGSIPQAYVTSIFPNTLQPRYDLYSNFYNPG